ncbi:DUF664 domain-containing protein [Streptomyces sp. SID4919]|uniref:DinB family protein n=1 Tax=unclassified Streptomyces TaxID=2593676 RepID=UPI000C06F29C|nr:MULTISPECIES: DinB family protein [unclassified Streptomyces]MYY13241.1 DUF664 domain-containing protein [Streptomyces sp. SID4919]
MAITLNGRTVPPPQAGERELMEAWLDFHRETVALKCAGLDDAQLREPSAPPSSMTLLGLVQHLAEVERNWFQRVWPGRDAPPVFEDAGPDGFALTPERGIEEALSVWRAEIARGREAIAGASLDDCGTMPEAAAPLLGGTRQVSLRWILLHIIEEYARHNGHADLLRERIDGATGP